MKQTASHFVTVSKRTVQSAASHVTYKAINITAFKTEYITLTWLHPYQYLYRVIKSLSFPITYYFSRSANYDYHMLEWYRYTHFLIYRHTNSACTKDILNRQ
jgi:predicted glycosyl hydrolase (DUF1957 family)